MNISKQTDNILCEVCCLHFFFRLIYLQIFLQTIFPETESCMNRYDQHCTGNAVYRYLNRVSLVHTNTCIYVQHMT